MKPFTRAWQIVTLLSSISYLKSFKSFHCKQQLLPRNNLQELFRSFSTSVGYGNVVEMSNLEETEFYLYSDSIDNKLLQGEYNPSSDPFLSSSRGMATRKGPIVDSTQLDNKTLELMIRKETENAVRSVSLFGGLLSILVTRDIWYAASSFLIVNIFATQANGFGTVTRIIGARIDLLMREIGKVGRLLTEFCFKGDIERNSFKEISRGNSAQPISQTVNGMRYIANVEPAMYKDYSTIIEERTVEEVPRRKAKVTESKYYYDAETPADVEQRQYPSVPVSNMAAEYVESATAVTPVMKEVLNIIAPVVKNLTTVDSSIGSSAGNASISNPSRIPLGTLISSAAKSTVTMKPPPTYIPPPPSAVYAATATMSGKTVTVGGVSEAVVNATIEVQAAADAAAERLKIWLQQQRKVEEQKRRDKIVGQLELSRGRDTSRERKDLLVEMSLFITSTDATLADKTATSSISEGNRSSIADPKAVKSKPSSSTSSMADSDKSPPRNISADSSTDSDVSKADPRSLPKIFSRRAIECRVGSIHDFVAVLLSPGKNTLKQRYRHLTLEFHPDSVRNCDLPKDTINSLMANLTGAFNYLSGENSLSADGTLLSLSSPWGSRYTGAIDGAATSAAPSAPSAIKYPNRDREKDREKEREREGRPSGGATSAPKSSFEHLRSPLKAEDAVDKRRPPAATATPPPSVTARTASPVQEKEKEEKKAESMSEVAAMNESEMKGNEAGVSASASAASLDSKIDDDQSVVGTRLNAQRDSADSAMKSPIDPPTIPTVSPSRIRDPLPLASTYNQFPSTGPPKPSKKTVKASTAAPATPTAAATIEALPVDVTSAGIVDTDADSAAVAAAPFAVTATSAGTPGENTPLPSASGTAVSPQAVNPIGGGMEAKAVVVAGPGSSGTSAQEEQAIKAAPSVSVSAPLPVSPPVPALVRTEEAAVIVEEMRGVSAESSGAAVLVQAAVSVAAELIDGAVMPLIAVDQIGLTAEERVESSVDSSAPLSEEKEERIGAVVDSAKQDTVGGKGNRVVENSGDVRAEVRGKKDVEGIDWEKMKFRGSDIYYRAQGGVEGGRDFRNDLSGGGGGRGGAARVVGKKKSYAAYIPPARTPTAPGPALVPIPTPVSAVAVVQEGGPGVPLDLGPRGILKGAAATSAASVSADPSLPPTASSGTTYRSLSDPTPEANSPSDRGAADAVDSKAFTESKAVTENINLSSESKVLTERERVEETAVSDDQHSGPANISASAPSPTADSAVTSSPGSQTRTYKARSVRAAYVMAAPQVTEMSSWVSKGARRLVSSSPSTPLSVSAALLSSATRTVAKVPILPSLAAKVPLKPSPAHTNSNPNTAPGPAVPLSSRAADVSVPPPVPAQHGAVSASASVPSVENIEPSSPQSVAQVMERETEGQGQGLVKGEGEGRIEAPTAAVADIPSASQQGPSEAAAPASSDQKASPAPALPDLNLEGHASPAPLITGGSLDTPSASTSDSISDSTEYSKAEALSPPIAPTSVPPSPPQSVAASLGIAESLRSAIFLEETEVRARTLLTTVTDIIFGPLGSTVKAGVKSPLSLGSPTRADGQGVSDKEGEEDSQGGSTVSALSPPKGDTARLSDIIDGYSPATAGSTAKRTWQARVPREFKTTASLLSAASPSPKLSPTMSQLAKKKAQSLFVPPPSAIIKPAPLLTKAPPVYAYPTQLEEAETVRRTYGLVVGTDEDLLTAKSNERIIENSNSAVKSGNIVGSSTDPAGAVAEDGTEVKAGQNTVSEEELQEAKRARKEAEARARAEWVETVMARAKDLEIRARKQKKASEKKVSSSSFSSSSKPVLKEKNSPSPWLF